NRLNFRHRRQYSHVKALFREALRIGTAGVGSDALTAELEPFDCIDDGFLALARKQNARRLTACLWRLYDVHRSATPEGDQRRTASLRLGQRNAEILASGKYHRTSAGERLHIGIARQKAGELDVWRRQFAKLRRLLSFADHHQLAVRHGAEGFDHEIRAL